MSRVRTFIAVEVSSPVRARIRELIDGLRATGASVSWVKPENLHLTLKFLGDVRDAELGAVCRAVADAAGRVEPFEVLCGGAGAFPDAHRPRTIWVGLQRGQPEILALYRALEVELAAAGFPKDNRQYHPHLTVGRVRRGGRPQQELGELIQEKADFHAGPTFVDEAIVFSSVLHGEGPTYDVLARAPLRE